MATGGAEEFRLTSMECMRTTLKSAMDAQHARPRLLSDLPGSNVFCCEVLLPIQPDRRCSQRVFCYFILRLSINRSAEARKHEIVGKDASFILKISDTDCEDILNNFIETIDLTYYGGCLAEWGHSKRWE